MYDRGHVDREIVANLFTKQFIARGKNLTVYNNGKYFLIFKKKFKTFSLIYIYHILVKLLFWVWLAVSVACLLPEFKKNLSSYNLTIHYITQTDTHAHTHKYTFKNKKVLPYIWLNGLASEVKKKLFQCWFVIEVH